MGGSTSKHDVGVYADLEVSKAGNGCAVSGQELRGSAYVRLPLPQQNAPTAFGGFSVQATLVGEECTTVSYQSNEYYDDFFENDRRTRTRSVTRYAQQSSRFLANTLTLHQGPWQGKGTDLAFPFAFFLPQRLPTTMADPFRGRDECSVRYYVLVEVYLWDNSRYQYAAPFCLMNPPPPQWGPLTIPPRTEVINLCCCIGKGTVTVAAHLPCAVQGSNKELVVGFELVNSSDVDVERVVLQVKESLRWTAEGHRHSQKRVLVENALPASALPDLTKKSSKGEAKAAINLDAAKSGAQKFIQAKLPWDALESYQGQLVSVEHYIKLIFYTGAFTSNLELKQDFTCYRTLPGSGGHGIQGPMAPAVVGTPVEGPSSGDTSAAHPLPGQNQTFEAAMTASAPPVPPNWKPVTAPLTMDAPPAPTAVADSHAGDLVATLRHSFDAVEDTRQWVAAGGGASISPQDLGAILGAVKLKLNQPLVAKELMQIQAKTITVDHCVAAALAAEGNTRGDIVRQMGPHVVDPQSAARKLKPILSSFQWTLVEPTFRRM